MFFALDRYRWITADGAGYWSLPPGAFGGVDLRPLPDCALAGAYGPRPCSVFIYRDDAVLDSDAILLGRGDAREWKPDAFARSAWQTLIGYRPQGETLAEWLADTLTFGSDPLGFERCAPLAPGVDRRLRLTLPGCGEVWQVKQRWGDAFTERIAARLHADYAVAEADDPEQARRVLDYWADKFRLTQGDDWKQLLPPSQRDDHPGLLPHETTFTESWPTNSTTISTGQDQPWTEVLNDSEVSGGLLRGVTGNTAKRNRCETTLSGTDHYCQATITHNGGATGRNNEVSVRFDAAADTSYSYRVSGASGGESIQKCVGGTFTSLASGARTNSLDTIYLEASGSSLQAKYAGSNSLSVTDTSISAGARIGAGGNGSGATWGLDSIVAADLAIAAGQPAVRRFGGLPHMRIRSFAGRSW